jgi:precorrin-6y C5,15-methyltransferase (decarboxylating) CbiE subunit
MGESIALAEKAMKKILIVGCGPGSPEYVTPAAVDACLRADVLLGSKRILDLFDDTGAERIEFTTDTMAAIKEIETRRTDKSVAALVSGDPGVFSLGGIIVKHFGREACEVIPGISSVQLAFSRIGLDWADSCILSAHHEKPHKRFAQGLEPDKIAILSGNAESLKWIAELLESVTYEKTVFVCENLGLENEKVFRIDEDALQSGKFSSKTIIISVRKELVS